MTDNERRRGNQGKQGNCLQWGHSPTRSRLAPDRGTFLVVHSPSLQQWARVVCICTHGPHVLLAPVLLQCPVSYSRS